MKRKFTTLILALLACALTGWPALAQTPQPKVKVKPAPVIVIVPAPAAPDPPAPPQEPKTPPPPKPAKAPAAPRPGRAPATPGPVRAPLPPQDWDEDEEISHAKTPAAPGVVVRLTLSQGDIIVRGWNKNEVEAEAESAGQVKLERPDESAEDTPAKQLNVTLRHKHERELAHGDGDCDEDDDNCDEDSADHVTLNVPQGATVYLKTANGDLHIMQVAEVDAHTSNGDLVLEDITRSVRGFSPNGDILLSNATGRIELRALSGDISVRNVRPGAVGDYLRATSASGDIVLDKVTHGNVEATTVSNEILFQGALARDGNYTFRTTNGDITLIIPADSSFRLNAKVSYGDINTDFACRPEGSGQSASELKKGRLTGICGKGEANLTLSTFNGSISLHKR